MSTEAKRKWLAMLCRNVEDDDLDLAIRVMQDFAARGLNEANRRADK